MEESATEKVQAALPLNAALKEDDRKYKHRGFALMPFHGQ